MRVNGKIDYNLLIGWVAIGALILGGVWMVSAMGHAYDAKCCPCECKCCDEQEDDPGEVMDFSVVDPAPRLVLEDV